MALTPWFRYFIKYDPEPVLQKVKCPVLALNGELDLQVPADQNLPAIEAALKAGGNKDYQGAKARQAESPAADRGDGVAGRVRKDRGNHGAGRAGCHIGLDCAAHDEAALSKILV